MGPELTFGGEKSKVRPSYIWKRVTRDHPLPEESIALSIYRLVEGFRSN
jgi:hypothetical protein